MPQPAGDGRGLPRDGRRDDRPWFPPGTPMVRPPSAQRYPTPALAARMMAETRNPPPPSVSPASGSSTGRPPSGAPSARNISQQAPPSRSSQAPRSRSPQAKAARGSHAARPRASSTPKVQTSMRPLQANPPPQHPQASGGNVFSERPARSRERKLTASELPPPHPKPQGAQAERSHLPVGSRASRPPTISGSTSTPTAPAQRRPPATPPMAPPQEGGKSPRKRALSAQAQPEPQVPALSPSSVTCAVCVCACEPRGCRTSMATVQPLPNTATFQPKLNYP